MSEQLTLHERIYRALLSAEKIEAAMRWRLMSPITTVTDDTLAQHIANEFWRLQFSILPFSTIAVRESLIDTMSFDNWWYDFEKYVIPAIIETGLPRLIST